MPATLSQATVTAWLERFCAEIVAAESRLNELDSATGDGEHGSNLSQGAAAVRALLRQGRSDDLQQQLEGVAMALVNSVGGASGALYGTFFLRLSDVGVGRTALGLTDLTEGLRSALAGIRELGGSAPGDKTLVDALHPAVAELDSPAARSAGLVPALDRAAQAAERGRDATAAMVARMGRGSYLGDRGRGHVDAGATSMAMLLRCLHVSAEAAAR
ncbi:dihydroxyacetone kinase subunit DhaL [Micromonospora sp. WMMD882]|uniref:dihydroxyacetone kinase subunit DhaL n=1 Tax=Micromonospora sp. WMMD882 TaxID=3015151 RepID=UPI00248CB274|nr:dihydroxyacetone kinase subunit DhaL [Micromonospora sp. WMMD882]WBB78471.1 dihydroxyacetone kinase subunit DhaL [Micromonospora sp. WMMD882]